MSQNTNQTPGSSQQKDLNKQPEADKQQNEKKPEAQGERKAV